MILRVVRDFLPWALSFPAGKIAVTIVAAVATCFGGYLFVSGQSAKTQVEVLRRDNTAITQQKQAVQKRLKTDNAVNRKPPNEKIKELGKWATGK